MAPFDGDQVSALVGASSVGQGTAVVEAQRPAGARPPAVDGTSVLGAAPFHLECHQPIPQMLKC